MYERLVAIQQPHVRLVTAEPLTVPQPDLARGRETSDTAIVFPSFGKELSQMNLNPAIDWLKDAPNGVLEYTVDPQNPTSYRLVGRELPEGVTPGHHLADRLQNPQKAELRLASKVRGDVGNFPYRNLPRALGPEDTQAALEADHPVAVVDFVLGEHPHTRDVSRLLKSADRVLQPHFETVSRAKEIEELRDERTIFDTHDRTANEAIRDQMLLARGIDRITGSRSPISTNDTAPQHPNTAYTMILAYKNAYGKDELHALVIPHAQQAQNVRNVSFS